MTVLSVSSGDLVGPKELNILEINSAKSGIPIPVKMDMIQLKYIIHFSLVVAGVINLLKGADCAALVFCYISLVFVSA